METTTKQEASFSRLLSLEMSRLTEVRRMAKLELPDHSADAWPRAKTLGAISMSDSNAFKRATELREAGDLAGIQKLFADGDARVKEQVLNGLAGKAGGGPKVALGVILLAVEGASHPSAMVRYWAADVIQQQGAYRVDVSAAQAALLQLLQDPDPKVRQIAAYATGNVCKQRLDWNNHFDALRRLLRDPTMYVPEAAARALANLSRAKFDISQAVTDLVNLLVECDDYNEPRKEAAKALLHHARKSDKARDYVRKAIRTVHLDLNRSEVRRFVDQLNAIE